MKNPSQQVKIPFDSLTLQAVTTELRAALIGGQIQDVRQPEQSEIRSHDSKGLVDEIQANIDFRRRF